MASARNIARWCVRVGVSLGIVAYILVDVDWSDLVRAFTHVQPALVAMAFALYLGGQVLSTIKWRVIGRSVGFEQSLAEYLRFYFVGMFFNLFGPSTVGGDVVRALYLGDARRRVMAVNSVVFDRLSGLAILMALGAAALLAFPRYAFPWPLTAAVVGGGIALVLGWWSAPSLVWILPRASRLRRQVEEALAPFWVDRGMLGRVALVSLVFHLSQVAVQWVLARAVGAPLPFSYCLAFHPMLSVMVALPLSLGGLGVREGGYLYFLTRIDVDDSLAVTMGLLWWALTVFGGLVGGLIFLGAGGALPRLRAPAPSPGEPEPVRAL